MKEKLYRFFYTAPIGQVLSIPMFIGLFLILSPTLFNQSLPNFLDHGWFSLILGFFVFGICGFPIVIREESPIPFFRSGKKSCILWIFYPVLNMGNSAFISYI